MIARVFARKTKATPVDEYAFYDEPGLFMPDNIKEVHVSCTFTDDLPKAEYLARSWQRLGLPVKVGGVAYADKGGEFIPGMYLKHGYVITSRGCNNKCWFCSAWKNEGELRELEVKDGWNLLDNNILQCSEDHIKTVFDMFKRQPKPIILSGGIEAKLLKRWHVELLSQIKLTNLFCAYDTPDDLEPLIEAGKLLDEANINVRTRKASCYVLIGYKGDSISEADKRLQQTLDAGFVPFAMLYNNTDREWKQFQRTWARREIIFAKRNAA